MDSSSTPLFATLCVIFIISVPVQFISPIITGAVSWIPKLAMSPSQPVNVTHPGDTPGWTYHRDYENSRFYEVMQALAHSSLATTANFSDSSRHISRRRIPSLQGFPANSSVQEVIMPYLNIESLEWLQSLDEILPHMDLFKNVTSNDTFKLSIIPSERMNPYFHGGDPGRVTIAFAEEWSLKGSYPAAKVVRGEHYVVVSTNGRQKCGDPKSDDPFGRLNGLYHLDARTGTSRFNNWHDPSCYVIARMEYSAGIVICRDCRLGTGGIVETTLQDESVVIADPLAEQALRMMPDVLALMSVSHSWRNWMQPGNLDDYTKGMLSVAYQASWNSMANVWSNDTTMRRTALSLPFPALTASITTWRVWTWLAMNCLLTVSGVIVAILQKQAFAKTVRNPELSLLLLDTKQLIEKSAPGLCNAVQVDKEDTDLRMRLQFQEGHESSHQHPYIEVQNSTYRRIAQDCSFDTLVY
ncbi:uncharacterized protein EKO05_0002721 [Ascochyta rabiei]|uniref:Uncharacterized protein n=1 Tax=Didymella rabiei TaxID=5454 RepID=A0A163BUR6_DIDRA|nr:uncharacterized protein EKO05_0002721 [Ascochyta rabiei]KZM22008.1 hypothetical protein ST47_g6854 [Ascochyta rabiei]UPX12154.1 hypothetical protein EKO05_0002721 [Ascochyta rabiei]